MNLKSSLLGFALGLAVAPAASAQVTFTLTASALADGFGYTQGESYSFVFVASDSSSLSTDFGPALSYWFEEFLSQEPLWTALSGSGLRGDYVRPADTNSAPWAYVGPYERAAGQFFTLIAASDSVSDLGVSTPDFTSVRGIDVDLKQGGLPDFTYPGYSPSISAYFADFVGTYVGFAETSYMQVVVSGRIIDFTPESLAISVIPEPSSATALGPVNTN